MECVVKCNQILICFIRDGIYCTFDENVPQGENSYYFAICGMSVLPYEISFEPKLYVPTAESIDTEEDTE